MSSLPQQMSAVEISTPGGPEVLKLVQRPLPSIKADEVLIQVHAAGINRPDVLQRKGAYPAPKGASDLPGLEVAGVIVQIGSDVTDWRIGERICALVPGGGYAEYCATAALQCLPVPQGFSMVEAASLPETFFTVWSNVFDRAKLAPNESLLVQGGTSGIGVAAIQMAKTLGHTVFATAGTKEKCDACEKLGAIAINYNTEDFAEVIKNNTNGKGVDVILDMIGGDYIQRELNSLADDGRLVFINTMKGREASIDFRAIMQRRLTITGSTLRPRSAEFKGAIAKNLREKIWPLIESGKIQSVVFKTYPLQDAHAAHALMESGQHIGKIVLVVRNEQ